MVGKIVAGLSALLVGNAALAQTPAPLEPSGKWTVEYAENMCVLSRSYGEVGKTVTVAVRSLPLSSIGEVIVITPKARGEARQGTGKIAIGRPDALQTARYSTYPLQKRGIQLTTFSVDNLQKDALQEAGIIRVSADGWDYTLALRGTKAALVALDACGRDLLKGWGFDPDESKQIAKSARSISAAEWIIPDDYPSDAIREGWQGAVIIGWAIGLDGRVSNCRTLQTSTVPLLDRAACQAITRRGRYDPAVGLDGKSIVSHATRRVKWSLPVE